MLRVLLVFSLALGFLTCLGHVQFTNLKCNITNSILGDIKECRIIAVNRTHKYISVFVTPHFSIDSKLMANFKALRNDQGYKPFFIDITFNICTFLEKKGNSILNLIYNTFRNRSNLNHSCPINHDIIIDKLWTGNYETAFLNLLPIPNGEYALIFRFFTVNTNVGYLKIYVKIAK